MAVNTFGLGLHLGSQSKNRNAKKSKVSGGISASTILEAELKKVTGFITEHKFHHTRKWRLDYYIPELKIAIELHGGAYTQGRHTRGKGFTEDREKMNEAQLAGILVLEVTSEQVKNGLAISLVKRAIELRRHE